MSTEMTWEPATVSLEAGWLGGIDLQTIVSGVGGTPVFVYSEAQLDRNVQRILRAVRRAGLDNRVLVFVPFFPNSNQHVIGSFRNLGVGILVQLPSEFLFLRRAGFSNFIVSPGHVSDDEIDFWSKVGHPIYLSSLGEVESAIKLHAPSICARIDGLNSTKPGIKPDELDELALLLRNQGVELESFEVYYGSGNTLDEMLSFAESMFDVFNTYFPTARSINFAGGHGFSYEAWGENEKHFDWPTYLAGLAASAREAGIPEHVQFLFEPARDVLADIGVLVVQVKRDIITKSVGSLVATDGSRMLMPSAQLRDRRHRIIFFDESGRQIPSGGDGVYASIRGRSILRNDYILPGEYWVPDEVGAGSYLAILDVGAYCATQHMEFLNIPPAPEVLIDRTGMAHLVTARGDEFDKWRNVLPEKECLGSVTRRELK